MSGKATGRVMEMDVQGARRDVLLAIADCADINGENALCSLYLIAYLSGLTRRWAAQTVRDLITDGWVSRTGKGAAGRSIYRINFEACKFKPPFGEWFRANNEKRDRVEANSTLPGVEANSTPGVEANSTPGVEDRLHPGVEPAGSTHYGRSTVVSTVGKKEARSARPSLSVSPEMRQQGSPWRAHPSVRFWHQAFEARQLRLSEAAAKKVAQVVGDDERRRTAWESAVAIWQQHPSWHPQHVDRLLDRMESIVRDQDGEAAESGGTATVDDQAEAEAGLVRAISRLLEEGKDVAFLRESVEADGFCWDAVQAAAGGVACK